MISDSVAVQIVTVNPAFITTPEFTLLIEDAGNNIAIFHYSDGVQTEIPGAAYSVAIGASTVITIDTVAYPLVDDDILATVRDELFVQQFSNSSIPGLEDALDTIVKEIQQVKVDSDRAIKADHGQGPESYDYDILTVTKAGRVIAFDANGDQAVIATTDLQDVIAALPGISALTARVDGNESDIATHETRIDGHDAQIAQKQDVLTFTPERRSNKDIANGYPGLDSSGEIIKALASDALKNSVYRTSDLDAFNPDPDTMPDSYFLIENDGATTNYYLANGGSYFLFSSQVKREVFSGIEDSQEFLISDTSVYTSAKKLFDIDTLTETADMSSGTSVEPIMVGSELFFNKDGVLTDKDNNQKLNGQEYDELLRNESGVVGYDSERNAFDFFSSPEVEPVSNDTGFDLPVSNYNIVRSGNLCFFKDPADSVIKFYQINDPSNIYSMTSGGSPLTCTSFSFGCHISYATDGADLVTIGNHFLNIDQSKDVIMLEVSLLDVHTPFWSNTILSSFTDIANWGVGFSLRTALGGQPAFSYTTTYGVGDRVSWSGYEYISRIAGNFENVPLFGHGFEYWELVEGDYLIDSFSEIRSFGVSDGHIGAVLKARDSGIVEGIVYISGDPGTFEPLYLYGTGIDQYGAVINGGYADVTFFNDNPFDDSAIAGGFQANCIINEQALYMRVGSGVVYTSFGTLILSNVIEVLNETTLKVLIHDGTDLKTATINDTTGVPVLDTIVTIDSYDSHKWQNYPTLGDIGLRVYKNMYLIKISTGKFYQFIITSTGYEVVKLEYSHFTRAVELEDISVSGYFQETSLIESQEVYFPGLSLALYDSQIIDIDGTESIYDNFRLISEVPGNIDDLYAAWDNTSDTVYLYDGVADLANKTELLSITASTGNIEDVIICGDLTNGVIVCDDGAGSYHFEDFAGNTLALPVSAADHVSGVALVKYLGIHPVYGERVISLTETSGADWNSYLYDLDFDELTSDTGTNSETFTIKDVALVNGKLYFTWGDMVRYILEVELIDWDQIQNVPDFAPGPDTETRLGDLETDTHTHTNKALLDTIVTDSLLSPSERIRLIHHLPDIAEELALSSDDQLAFNLAYPTEPGGVDQTSKALRNLLASVSGLPTIAFTTDDVAVLDPLKSMFEFFGFVSPIDNLGQLLDSVGQHLTGINVALGDFFTAISDNGDDITALDLRVTANELLIDGLDSSALEARIVVNETDIGLLGTQVAAIEDDVTPRKVVMMYDGGDWVDNVTWPGWYACVAANAAQGCPDMVGRMPIGKIIAGAGSPSSGTGSVTLQESNMPTHNHGVTAEAGSLVTTADAHLHQVTGTVDPHVHYISLTTSIDAHYHGITGGSHSHSYNTAVTSTGSGYAASGGTYEGSNNVNSSSAHTHTCAQDSHSHTLTGDTQGATSSFFSTFSESDQHDHSIAKLEIAGAFTIDDAGSSAAIDLMANLPTYEFLYIKKVA